MPGLPHGTRRRYQVGCACTPCRAAEAAYRSARRKAQARGTPALGSHVSARAMWRRIRALQGEGFTLAEIARRLGGLRCPRLQLHTDRVTLKNFLKVRTLYRRIMLDELE